MKKINQFSAWLRIVLFVFTLGLVYSFGYSAGNEDAALQNETLTLEKAKLFYSLNTSPEKAILIDAEALNTMNALLAEKRGATGVRLYFGKDQSQKAANFMVAVNGNTDDVGLILRTNGTASTCPNFCDKESPIQK